MTKDKEVREGAGRQREYRKVAIKSQEEESKRIPGRNVHRLKKDPYIKKSPITEDTE